MQWRTLRTPMCALSLAISALAQNTWIVDLQNGPGTNFVDLQSAVAAAAPGDTLLVGYVDPLLASYSGTTIDKALTVVGIGGQPGIVGQLRVALLPAGQHVQLRNLRLAPFAVPGGQVGDCQLIVASNQGSVHLHGIDRDISNPLVAALNQTAIFSNRLVTLTECSLPNVGALGVIQVADCERVVMSQCQVTGAGATAFNTMSVARSTLVLIDSVVSGLVAIRTCDAQLRLAGTTVVQGTVAVSDGSSAQCVAASTVTVAPTAALGPTQGGPLVTGAPVVAHSAYVDQTKLLTLELTGTANSFGVLSFGMPLATPVPLWDDLYWLDVSTVVVFGLLPLAPNGRASWSAQLGPAVPSGTSLWLQAAILEPSGFTLAPPAVAITP